MNKRLLLKSHCYRPNQQLRMGLQILLALIWTILSNKVFAKLSLDINLLNNFDIANIDSQVFDWLHIDTDLDDVDLQNVVEFVKKTDICVMTNQWAESLENTLKIINIESIISNEKRTGEKLQRYIKAE